MSELSIPVTLNQGNLCAGKTIYVNGVPSAQWSQIQQQITTGKMVTVRPISVATNPQFVAVQESVSAVLAEEVGVLSGQFAARYSVGLSSADPVERALYEYLGNVTNRTAATKLASQRLGINLKADGINSWTTNEGWAQTLPKTAANRPAILELAKQNGPISTTAPEVVRLKMGNKVEFRVLNQKGGAGPCRIHVEPYGDAVSVRVVSGQATRETIKRVLGELQQSLGRLGIRPTICNRVPPRITPAAKTTARTTPRGIRARGGGMVMRSLAVLQVFSVVISQCADAKAAEDPQQVAAIAEAVMRGQIIRESLYLTPLWGPVNEYIKTHYLTYRPRA